MYNHVWADIIRLCHSERAKRRGILLPQNQNSVILNTVGVKNPCSCINTNSFYAALALLSLKKVTKDVGVAIPPRPTNAAQVWNAPPAINHGILPSFITFTRQRILA